ncbi:F-box/LRR-repeat protein 20-like isoform X2 [Culicoides brevitarsis]|uniref:F-box/LRR-repeat protein 20-like isoform X2 n=1 Tax=Culicoides brevitarsis TaxID=469753 RepID=UPI00307C7E04
MDRLSYEYISFGHNYEDLPMEILIKIFEYLNPTDILIAGLVCRRWLEASQHTDFMELFTLSFNQVNFTDDSPPIKDFQETFRNFRSVTFNNVEFGSTEKFGGILTEDVHELSIKNCDIREKKLKEIISPICNLKTLRIEACRELLMDGRLFDIEKENKALMETLSSVENLSLANNRYLSDALFNRIVSFMPNIERLDLSGCHISFHQGLYRKFYPGSQLEPSESVLTFLHISDYIEKNSAKLKYLNLSLTLIDGKSLETLANTPELKLESLMLRSCDQISNPGILRLVQVQQNLTSLDLSLSMRVTDQTICEIVTALPRLKVLKARRCRALTDISVRELLKLTELRTLDVSECDSITGIGFIDGISNKKFTNLRELYVSALNICSNTVMKITEAFPELTILDVSCCFNSVTDLCVQLIIKNLVKLRYLNVEMCDKITDAGLTGLSMGDELAEYLEEQRENEKKSENKPPQDQAASSSSPKESPSQVIERLMVEREQNYYKISLGSKAETEIKHDAKRKKAMQEMCETDSCEENASGYGISRLRGLRVLKLGGCNRVTDVSLKYSFKLRELKELGLERCYQVSIEGMKAIADNCPSIEILNLAECHTINDKAVEYITEHLHRLTRLSLEKCIQLTDFSLDYISMNCKALQLTMQIQAT